MRIQELLSLPHAEQKAWVMIKFPNFEMKAYEETIFGAFYDVSDHQLEDYLEYPEKHETFGILSSALPNFTDTRAAEIEAGSSLSKAEELAIKRHIADQDMFWTGLHGWKAECDDGEVFVCFCGHSTGGGGIELEYFGVFETERHAHICFETFEIFAYV
jgi:hypothetical protein